MPSLSSGNREGAPLRLGLRACLWLSSRLQSPNLAKDLPLLCYALASWDGKSSTRFLDAEVPFSNMCFLGRVISAGRKDIPLESTHVTQEFQYSSSRPHPTHVLSHAGSSGIKGGSSLAPCPKCAGHRLTWTQFSGYQLLTHPK